MAVNLNLPSRQTGTAEQQLNGLYSYLYQLVEALNVTLNKDASSAKVLYKAGGGAVDSGSSALPESTAQEYRQLKALIIKTATEVTSNIRKIVTEISQEYIAQSVFGTYSEFLNNKITQGADGYLMEWDAENKITTSVASFGEYVAQSDVYMRIGIVKYNDDGTVEAGVVVGKNFQKVTVDGREYITSEDVYALFTAEEISFWQSGVCKSRLSLTGLVANQAYINELTAANITAESINAATAYVGELEAESITAEKLTANMLQIDKLIASVIESEGGDASIALDEGLVSAIAKKIDLSANESIRLIVGDPVQKDDYHGIRVHAGQIAQDECLEDQGIRVYSEIELMQSGSGEPSPDNIRPIIGRTGAKLVRCGKNLLKPSEWRLTYGVAGLFYNEPNLSITANADNVIVGTGYQGGADHLSQEAIEFLRPATVKGGKAYTFSFEHVSGTGLAYYYVQSYAKDGTPLRFEGDSWWLANAYTAPVTFKLPDDAYYLTTNIQFVNAAAGETIVVGNIQLEESATGTGYEAYHGDTFSIDFGDAVYSGKLDWNTGLLTVDWKTVSLSGNESSYTFFYNGAYRHDIYGVIPGAYNDGNWANLNLLCSHYSVNSAPIGDNTINNAVAGYMQDGSVYIRDDRFTDTGAYRAYLAAQYAAGTPVQICYRLAEPYTIQLTPQQIVSFAGINTVYTDLDGGRIEFGHDSLATYLQSQIDLIPGKIELAVSDVTATGLRTGSNVTITKDEVNINSPVTTISIPVAGSVDGAEKVSIDEDGLRADVITADEINCPGIVQAVSAGIYYPANAGEMQAILDKLKGGYLEGDVTIDAAAVTGGSFRVEGLHGAGQLIIQHGVLNSIAAYNCQTLLRINSLTISSSGTAITLDSSAAHFNGLTINAALGLNMNNAHALMYSCGGTCTTLAMVQWLSVLQIAGDSLPYGTVHTTASDVYSTMEFVSSPSAPSVTEVNTATLTAINTRTWGGDWLSTGTYGTAMYQGTTGGGTLRRGCMWFDLSAISGKTIVSATLTMKRVSGIGGGGSVAIGIYGTNATGASGTPAIGSKYAEISLANGASGSVDVTGAVQALANGSINGLMIYDARTGTFGGKTYTYGYVKVYGTGGDAPTLSVTYK